MSKLHEIGSKVVYELNLTKDRHPLSSVNQYTFILPHSDSEHTLKSLLLENKDKMNIDKMLIIRDNPQIYNNKIRIARDPSTPLLMSISTFNINIFPDELTITKHNNGQIDIKLYNFDNTYNKNITSLYPQDSLNSILIENIDITDIPKLMDLIIVSAGPFGNLYVDKMKNIIYKFVYDDPNYKESIFKQLITTNYPKAMDFLNNNMELLPLFIDIIYFEFNDPRYFEIVHEKINDVIVDDQKLKLYSDDDIKKI